LALAFVRFGFYIFVFFGCVCSFIVHVKFFYRIVSNRIYRTGNISRTMSNRLEPEPPAVGNFAVYGDAGVCNLLPIRSVDHRAWTSLDEYNWYGRRPV